MKNLLVKTISIFLLMAVVVSNLPLGTIVAGVVPSIAISSPSTKTVEEGSSVSYTLQFSDADEIKNVKNYIELIGFDATINVSGSGDRRTVTLSDVQGDVGKKRIGILAGVAENENGKSYEIPYSESFTLTQKTVVDDTTNNNTNSNTNNNGSTNEVDTTRPFISIQAPSAKNVKVGGSVSYVVKADDNKGVSVLNLSKDNIALSGFTADITVTGNGNQKTVTFSNIQGAAGKKTFVVKAGAVVDTSGNTSYDSAVSESFTLSVNTVATNNDEDRAKPFVSIEAPSAKEVYVGGTVSYVVVFSDNREIGKINAIQDYLAMNGFTADVKVTENGNSRTVTLSNIKGEVGAKCTILIKAGAAEDKAGNTTYDSAISESFKIIKKNTATTNTSNKLDNEPNTGVEELPVLPIMGAASAVLSIAGIVITKKIYG